MDQPSTSSAPISIDGNPADKFVYKGYPFILSHRSKKRSCIMFWKCARETTCTCTIKTRNYEVVSVDGTHKHESKRDSIPMLDSSSPSAILGKTRPKQLVYNGYNFSFHRREDNRVFWLCSQRTSKNCKCLLETKGGRISKELYGHTHPAAEETAIVTEFAIEKKRRTQVSSKSSATVVDAEYWHFVKQSIADGMKTNRALQAYMKRIRARYIQITSLRESALRAPCQLVANSQLLTKDHMNSTSTVAWREVKEENECETTTETHNGSHQKVELAHNHSLQTRSSSVGKVTKLGIRNGSSLPLTSRDAEILSRNGKPLFAHAGYLYRWGYRSRTVNCWRCTQGERMNCSSTLFERNGALSLRERHNHPPNQDAVDVALIRTRMQRRALQTTEDTISIYKACVDRWNPLMPTFNSMKSYIRRQRRKVERTHPEPQIALDMSSSTAEGLDQSGENGCAIDAGEACSS